MSYMLSHRVRIVSNNKFKTYCRKAFGCARMAYNWGVNEFTLELAKYKESMELYNTQLERNRNIPEEHRESLIKPKFPSVLDLKKRFNAIKSEQFSYVYEVTKYATQQPFINLQKAISKYYEAKKNKKTKVGFPKFKKKSLTTGSFYIGGDQVNLARFKTNSKIENKTSKLCLNIPRFGWVKLAEDIRFSGHINSVTIVQEGDEFYACFSIKVEEKSINKTIAPKNTAVGIDFGIEAALTLSDGVKIYAPKPLKKSLSKLKALQRKLSKKQHPKTKDDNTKYSKSYFRMVAKIKKVYSKIKNLRRDFINKVASFIARNYEYVVLEDLNVKGMMSNHKLASSLADISFGMMRERIIKKVEFNEGTIVKADRFYPSSKKCCKCGAIKQELKLSERIYNCSSCGNTIDRDIQASLNLLNLIEKNGVANAVKSPELRSILADLEKNQLANLVMKA